MARSHVARLTAGDGLPPARDLPRYVAPLPRALENLGLSLAVPIAAINLLGTAFGFWYYLPQFGLEPPVAWPVVPDSPMATLFIACSLLAWRFDAPRRLAGPLHALGFFGCIKLGLWTPYVLFVFRDGFAAIDPALYSFMFVSHLAMVAEAFVIHRYFDFRVGAVAVAAGWYLFNDVVDYFVPIVGGPHHSLLPGEAIVYRDGVRVVEHVSPAHDLAAAAAVVLTVLATFLALATRVELLEAGSGDAAGGADEPLGR